MPDHAGEPERGQDPYVLEHDVCEALSSGRRCVAKFLTRVPADEVLMLFPNGQILFDLAEAIELMSGPPWSSHEFQDSHHRRTDRLLGGGAFIEGLADHVAPSCIHTVII